jgi:hypothetical protein
MHKVFSVLAVIVMVTGALALSRTPTAAADVTLYKNPQCGCCEGYAEYLRQNGFTVTVRPTHELVAMSRAAGIPDAFQGCHLSFIEDYVVSGHVPVNTVNQLLSERPDIKGVTLPGMPMGSPGMVGEKTELFTIYEIGDGPAKIYGVE